MTAKSLYFSKKARTNIQEQVALLTTRVKGTGEDDYKKLGRVIIYLWGDPETPLTMEADNKHVVKWWVDASFGVHSYMNIHKGEKISLWEG